MKRPWSLHFPSNIHRYIFGITGVALICLFIASPYILDVLQGNVRIVFYGRVVDETGRAVSGAEVTMNVLATKRLAIPAPFAENQTGWMVRATTDASGSFTLYGGRGLSIEMTDVKKVGYGTPTLTKSGGNFIYTSQYSGVPPYRPDPQHPAIFRLPHLKP